MKTYLVHISQDSDGNVDPESYEATDAGDALRQHSRVRAIRNVGAPGSFGYEQRVACAEAAAEDCSIADSVTLAADVVASESGKSGLSEQHLCEITKHGNRRYLRVVRAGKEQQG